MTNVLNQAEINALLNAIDEGSSHKCFIIKDNMKREAELEDILPLIEKDKGFQLLLSMADNYFFAHYYELGHFLVYLPDEIKEIIYRNVSPRTGCRWKRQVDILESNRKKNSANEQRRRADLMEFLRKHWDSLWSPPKSVIWNGTKQTEAQPVIKPLTPVESIIKSIENACVSGELSIGYGYFSKGTEEDVRNAFSSFQNRRDELARIRSLSVSGSLLSVVMPFLEIKNIRKLNIRDDLAELPVWIGDLVSLTMFSMEYNDCIKTIPDSIGSLQSLKKLSLEKCKNLKTLPDSVGNLQSLTELSLKENKNLKTLPGSIGNLKNLAVLDLRFSSVEKLPDSAAKLSALKYADIIGTNIHSVPGFFSSLETFIDNKQIEIIPQDGSLSYRSFVNSYYTLVETLFRFSEKAQREGLLALEDELLFLADDNVFQRGMRLMVDGTGGSVIRDTLTPCIEREHDFYRKKLMEIALEGVLGIQAGIPFYRLVFLLNSGVNIKNNPIDTACAQYFAGDIDAFSKIDFKAAILAEGEREEISFIKRAVKLSEISHGEGLLTIEKHLDHEKIAARDIFEYGLPLVLDGCEDTYINTVLTGLTEHETDPVQKNIALAKKEAVLSMKTGINPTMLFLKLSAYFDRSIAQAAKEDLF